MDKYAQEKIAQQYYQLGIQLALQNAGIGMAKTAAPKAKNIAAMLGIGGAGALGGASLASHLAPKAERAAAQLSDMAPMQLLRELGAAGQSRLAKMNYQADEILKNVDFDNPMYTNLFEGDMDMAERAAAAIKSVQDVPSMPMINYDGSTISKMDALNYLNPFAKQNVFSKDTLKGMGYDLDDIGQAAKLTLQDIGQAIPSREEMGTAVKHFLYPN